MIQSCYHCARRDLLFIFLHDVATMERAGSARPVPSPVVRRLLTERLVTVPPDTVSDKAAALFHAAFQHVALKARAGVRKSLAVLGVLVCCYFWFLHTAGVTLHMSSQVAVPGCTRNRLGIGSGHGSDLVVGSDAMFHLACAICTAQ